MGVMDRNHNATKEIQTKYRLNGISISEKLDAQKILISIMPQRIPKIQDKILTVLLARGSKIAYSVPSGVFSVFFY